MNYTEQAREIVSKARQSNGHISWLNISELPCSFSTMQRLVHTVSKGGCKIKTHNGKFVVIDLSWIAD